MKIGFDAKRIFNNSTGLGNYSRSLIQNLNEFYPENDYLLFTPKINQDVETQFFQDTFPIIQPSNLNKPLWRSRMIAKDIKNANCDIYHGLSNELPQGLKDVKKIVTIHDLIFKVLPDTYSIIDRTIYDRKTKHSCEIADVIIAISENTKKDIIKYYGIAENKIKVIHQSVNPIYYKDGKAEFSELMKKLKIPSEFILSVGSLEERKNVLGILKAVQLMNPKDRIPLVVIGNGKKYKKKLIEFIEKNNLQKWIFFVEKILNLPELKCMYEAASLFIYPSFYEGFGLPVVEAMLSKTPVITSDISSLPEAAGHNSILIDPNNPKEIKDAIISVLNDNELHKKMITNGHEYAMTHFNIKKTSSELMGLYEGLL